MFNYSVPLEVIESIQEYIKGKMENIEINS